jgi:hypothetical protein
MASPELDRQPELRPEPSSRQDGQIQISGIDRAGRIEDELKLWGDEGEPPRHLASVCLSSCPDFPHRRVDIHRDRGARDLGRHEWQSVDDRT